MKLLTPTQQKARKDDDTLREILRGQEMNKFADNARKNLAKAEAEFDESMAKQKKAWEEASATHKVIADKERAEIEALEARRARAMMPVNALLDEATIVLHNAIQKEAEAEKQQVENEELAERLQDKLDAVGEREQSVARATAKLDNREKGIEDQAGQVTVSVKQLGNVMRDFEIYKTGVLKDLDERKTALSLWDINLQARENRLTRNTEALMIKEKQQADERGNLEAGFKELREGERKLSP